MVEGHGGALVGVAVDVENVPAYHTQRVGDDGAHMAVLLYVLGQRVSHKTPAAYVAHPGDIGEKVFRHGVLLCKLYFL